MRKFNANNFIEISKELSRTGIRPKKTYQVTGRFVFDHKIPNWLASFIKENNGKVIYEIQ